MADHLDRIIESLTDLGRDELETLARGLDTVLNGAAALGHPEAKRFGFALFVFEFGVAGPSEIRYVSSAEREFMKAAVTAWLANETEMEVPRGEA